MASPTVTKHLQQANAAAATSVAKAWGSATASGARLLAVVSFEANGQSNVPITPADTTWKLRTPGRIVRQSAGVDELVVAVYEILNSGARSGTETFNLGASVFATLELIEIAGSDPNGGGLTPTSFSGNGLSFTIPDPGSPTSDVLAIAIGVNGNPASTQSQSWGTLLDDIAPGTTGTDRERTDIFTKNVASGVAVGSAAITVSGATNRNLAGIMLVIPAAPTGGGGSSDITVVQHGKYIAAAAATSHSAPWPFATGAGNRLIAVVAINNNGANQTITPPAGWTLISPPGRVDRVVTVDVTSLWIYEVLNASVRSANEVFSFGNPVFANIELIELFGSSTATAIDVQTSGSGSGTLADTGSTSGAVSVTSGLSLAAMCAANNNTLSPDSTFGYSEVDSGNTGGGGATNKLSFGIYQKPISASGLHEQLQILIGGGISRAWCAALIVIPSANQSTGGGGGSIGGSPFLANLDDGRRHGAASIHYGSPITSQGIADTMVAMYDIIFGTYDASGGQFNDFLPSMFATKPSLMTGFYNKSVQSTGASTQFPNGMYAHTAGGAKINTFSSSIWVMQPDSNDAYTDSRFGLIHGWKEWISHDHKFQQDHENGRHANTINCWYGDSMGTSSYKGTQVNPTTSVAYTQSQWLGLVWSIGDAMRALAPSATMVWGNGLIGGPSYHTTKGLMSHVDGAIAENWLRNNFSSVTSFFTEANWLLSVNQAIDVQVNFKKAIWIIINIANYAAGSAPSGWVAPTTAQMDQWHRYAYCSYLLGQRGSSLYEFVENSLTVKHYEVNHQYWSVRLGAPLDNTITAEAMKPGSGQCYSRRFANGVVIVNPTPSNATFTCDADYVDPVSGATHLTGAVVTIAPNQGFIYTTTRAGTPNTAAPTVTWNNPPLNFSDTPTHVVQVTIDDPDGVATPANLKLNGADKGTWTEVGSGTTHRVFTKSITFVDRVASTLSFTVADVHPTPLTASASRTVTYTAPVTPPPPPPPPTDTPPPPPPTSAGGLPTAGEFARHVLDELQPLNYK